MHSGSDLTQAQLKELLTYDPQTGRFRNLKGKAIGSARGHRYVRIDIGGRMYYAHRLAWLYMTGSWPQHGVDHRDGVRTNNAWANLREATQAENLQNSMVSRGRTSSMPGVSWHKAAGKWRAAIAVDGKQKHLGLFDDEAEAGRAYVDAKRELHPFAFA